MIFALQGKPGHWLRQPFAPLSDAPDRKKLIAAAYYVGYARRVDRAVAVRPAGDPWDPPDPEEVRREEVTRRAQARPLFESGQRALAAAKDPFLRQRYAFQLVRLLFHSGDGDRCIAFFDAHRDDLGADGSPYWRALGYAAGAHYRARRFADANVLYARIFDRFPPMKVSAYWSFHPQEEADWNQALSKAGPTREKTVLWQMLGIAKDGPRAIHAIHALDPRSDLLPLLVAREVNRRESACNVVFSRGGVPDCAEELKRDGLLAFVEERSEKGDVFAPTVWDLAAAHMRAITGDGAAARRLLDRALARGTPPEAVARQVRVTGLLARLAGMRAGDPSAEDFLARELAWVEERTEGGGNERMVAFLANAKLYLSDLYAAEGRDLAAVCLSDRSSPIYRTAEGIDRVIALLDRKERTPFEEFLARSFPGRRDQLVEMKAIVALYDGEIAIAAARAPGTGAAELRADPFSSRINDCHDCDAADPNRAVYTKASFIARLEALRREAEKNPERAAQNWLEIGNAFYNITWYGNARDMYGDLQPKFSPVGECKSDRRGERCSLPGQMERAEAWYRKAYEVATDCEAKAKAAFLAAKCEQNVFFDNKPEGGPDFIAGRWFHKLREEYSGTDYYAEIVRECGYFRKFVGAGKAED